MNSVQLVGRLVRDPDVRYTDGGSTISKFTVAVDRRFQKQGEERAADFISCVSFGKTAEFIEKYFGRGQRIGLVGRIQTGNYSDKDGNKVYTTDIIVENAEFVESKNDAKESREDRGASTDQAGGFLPVGDGIGDEDLPF